MAILNNNLCRSNNVKNCPANGHFKEPLPVNNHQQSVGDVPRVNNYQSLTDCRYQSFTDCRYQTSTDSSYQSSTAVCPSTPSVCPSAYSQYNTDLEDLMEIINNDLARRDSIRKITATVKNNSILESTLPKQILHTIKTPPNPTSGVRDYKTFTNFLISYKSAVVPTNKREYEIYANDIMEIINKDRLDNNSTNNLVGSVVNGKRRRYQ